MKINSNITIKEVQNSDELKEFVMFPHKLYKGSKYWVAPITKEELEVLERHLDGYRDIGFLENFQWYGATAQFTLYFKNYRT